MLSKLPKPSIPALTIGLVLALHLFLVLKSLLPTLRDINQWDEAVYINTGRLLAQGELPLFARNPLVGVLYALTYFPFAQSPFWLLNSAALGRAILFGLMWLAAYLIGRELKPLASHWTMVGILIVIPVLTAILGNPSDALFAAMAAFAFWQFLAYRNHGELRHLAWASLFVGMAGLARNDGLILFLIFLALTLLLNLNSKPRWRWLAYAGLPFVILIAGYIGALRTSDRVLWPGHYRPLLHRFRTGIQPRFCRRRGGVPPDRNEVRRASRRGALRNRRGEQQLGVRGYQPQPRGFSFSYCLDAARTAGNGDTGVREQNGDYFLFVHDSRGDRSNPATRVFIVRYFPSVASLFAYLFPHVFPSRLLANHILCSLRRGCRWGTLVANQQIF
ncbi:MAG: hypothetical protein ACRDFQ_00425 [Anaerolineales bacterium]